MIISLGAHGALNGGENSACYACHGGNEGTKNHPVDYRSPRKCDSCHAATSDNYNAIYIGDEEHKNETCEGCHIADSHNIKAFDIIPSVKKVTIIKENNNTILKAFASAGYKMRLRGARYYIDSTEEKLNMSPSDGVFDTQVEEVSAQIDISKISPGKHFIYLEAMERDDKWGTPISLEINLEGEVLKLTEKDNSGIGLLLGGLAILMIIFRRNLNIEGLFNNMSE